MPWLIFDALVVVYWFSVSLLMVSEDRDPNTTLAWLAVLYAVPFLGLIVYFLFGRNWPAIFQSSANTVEKLRLRDRFMAEIYQPYQTASNAFAEKANPVESRVAEMIEKASGAPVLPARSIDLYATGSEYFDVLLADLASAKAFIHMSYFIWEDDALCDRIGDILLNRVAAGVEVRVLYDRLGSLAYSDKGLERLRAGGVFVGTDRLSIQLLNYRDHRKISVIDGEIGHTGGFNIGQEYIDGGNKYPAWRDTGIRLTGPAVADLEKLFHMRWFDLFGEDSFDEHYFPNPELPHGDILVQTVHQGFDERWSPATRAHQVAMSAATDRIQLQSPYFVPDKATFEILLNAAASGVQVDLLTTGWPDKEFPWWAAESYFEPLLTAGGRVWLWEPGFMHAKSLTIDGQICSVGSLNMDMRSLAINRENMVWIYNREITARHEAIFLDDLRSCRALTLEEVRSWALRRRLRNSFARLASNLL